jgi:hypothetical protein
MLHIFPLPTGEFDVLPDEIKEKKGSRGKV